MSVVQNVSVNLISMQLQSADALAVGAQGQQASASGGNAFQQALMQMLIGNAGAAGAGGEIEGGVVLPDGGESLPPEIREQLQQLFSGELSEQSIDSIEGIVQQLLNDPGQWVQGASEELTPEQAEAVGRLQQMLGDFVEQQFPNAPPSEEQIAAALPELLKQWSAGLKSSDQQGVTGFLQPAAADQFADFANVPIAENDAGASSVEKPVESSLQTAMQQLARFADDNFNGNAISERNLSSALERKEDKLVDSSSGQVTNVADVVGVVDPGIAATDSNGDEAVAVANVSSTEEVESVLELQTERVERIAAQQSPLQDAVERTDISANGAVDSGRQASPYRGQNAGDELGLEVRRVLGEARTAASVGNGVGNGSGGAAEGENPSQQRGSQQPFSAAVRADNLRDFGLETATKPTLGERASPSALGSLDDSSVRSAGLSAFQQLQQSYRGSLTNSGVTLSLPDSMSSDRWASGVSQRIMWMSHQQVGRAELRLASPDLGSLNIRLDIQQDQASVSFNSPHAHVREALEQQMPRLREMLAEQGIDLQQSDISEHSASGQRGEAESRSGARSDAVADLVDNGSDNPVLINSSLSLVDFYA